MREELGRVVGPHGEVALHRRHGEGGAVVTELVVDGVFAMDDVDTSTEVALAVQALARLDGNRLRVLVGGLGLGWTAASVLADPRVAAAVVAELQPALAGWAGDRLLPGLPDGPLDPRLSIEVGDVAGRLVDGAGWDAVLLDVDNGPHFLVRRSNAALYTQDGLRVALTSLRPGGVLAIWSSDPAPQLLARLSALPGAVDVEQVVLPVERDGRVLDYALLFARRAR